MKDLTIILGSAGFVGKSLYKYFKSKKSNVIGIDFLDGEVDESKKRNLVATNSLIHKELLDLIKKKNIEKD